MANYQRTICHLLAMLAVAFVAGCSASGPPPVETAYSAIGGQIK
jgi:hypothetical protein